MLMKMILPVVRIRIYMVSSRCMHSRKKHCSCPSFHFHVKEASPLLQTIESKSGRDLLLTGFLGFHLCIPDTHYSPPPCPSLHCHPCTSTSAPPEGNDSTGEHYARMLHQTPNSAGPHAYRSRLSPPPGHRLPCLPPYWMLTPPPHSFSTK